MGRPRKFIGPLTQKQQQKKDHAKVKKIDKLITAPRRPMTSSFPASMRVKERYFDYKPSDGAYYGFLFNTNSVYNPQRLSGGHQPNSRDTMVTIYSKYKVHGCTIKVRFISAVASAYLAALCVVNNTTTPETDIRKIIETPGCKFKASSVTSGDTVLTLKIDNATVAGVPKMVYEADSIYSAAVGSDPSEVMTAGVYFTKVDGTNLSAGYVYAEILITYDVTYYDPVIQAMS